MGQKVDPRGFRIGVVKSWPVEWFANTKGKSKDFFIEDIKVRNYVNSVYVRSSISKMVVRKTEKEGELIIFTAKPATIIGKGGEKLEKFQKGLEKEVGRFFKVTVKQIKNPELSSRIVSEFAAAQLESRMPFRRVGKQVLQRVMDAGGLGVKVQIGGRLGGADMARTEKFNKGRIPLQTIRADIDYHYTTALTKYGILGVKVWIYKGDFNKKSGSKKK